MLKGKGFIAVMVGIGLLLVGGCGNTSEMVTVGNDAEDLGVIRPEASYLEEKVPPCTKKEGSDTDPCAPASLNKPKTLSVSGSFPLWTMRGLPTFTEILLDRDVVTASVHLIVRGVVKFNTTRCDIYPLKVANYDEYGLSYKILPYHCFSDIDIREYIVGTGPSELTVSMHREVIFDIDIEDWDKVKEQELQMLNDPRSRTARAYEGKELLLFLGVTDTIAVEAFEVRGIASNLWFIQRSGDEIIAVANEYRLASNEEERRQLKMPLDELVIQLKKAAQERNSITGGRVGIDSALPLLVTDANFLREYYISVGSVYDDSDDATVLPPPVPGEDDIVPVTVPVDEGGTTVGSSVPVPGEDTDVPSPIDDAGLTVGQESTTTTVVDITTSSSVVETSVTTAVVPGVTTTSGVVESTTTTIAEIVTGTTTTTVVPVSTTLVPGGEDDPPLVDDGASEGDQVTTTSSTVVPSPSATSSTTTLPASDDIGPVETPITTVVVSAVTTTSEVVENTTTTIVSGGEDDNPLVDDGASGEGQVTTTSSTAVPSVSTTSSTTTLPGGDDIGPGEDPVVVPPADDGIESEGQADAGLAVNDG